MYIHRSMYFVEKKILETSENDIETYKVIRSVGFLHPRKTAPFMIEFEFNDLNGTYYTEDFFKEPYDIHGKLSTRGGFHSFKEFKDAVAEMDFLNEFSKRNETFEIVPCIIPANTYFCTGYEEGGIPVYCSCTLKLNY